MNFGETKIGNIIRKIDLVNDQLTITYIPLDETVDSSQLEKQRELDEKEFEKFVKNWKEGDLRNYC